MSVEVITLGCRLNAAESQVIREKTLAAGMDDAVVVNTCAVTSEAVRQARQTIRRVRREHPHARIVVTGCAVQTEPQTFANMPEVDLLVGNGAKFDIEQYSAGDASERIRVNDIMSVTETASHLISGFDGRARAFVQVQNGCDHRCTFCIIPFGRGPSRSVPQGEVVQQIRTLVEQGAGEIVLTGVDITSYGPDLPGKPTLGRLVSQILTLVPELKRLRLSSIDVAECDEQLFEIAASHERFMPHLHLSLQAGHNMILKRMKRRHSTQSAVEFCGKLRALRPGMVFGADFIAGFPTETDEMFEATLAHVRDCGLTYLHVFPYSAREGTPAAKMPPVSGTIVKKRAARLREFGEYRLAQHLQSLCGQTLDVMVEKPGHARTSCFAPVKIDPKFKSGHFLSVRITDADRTIAHAEACSN